LPIDDYNAEMEMIETFLEDFGSARKRQGQAGMGRKVQDHGPYVDENGKPR